MPRSRFDELATLSGENDGLVTADRALQAGFTDSVLARLVQRGRIERLSRGVYRVPYFSPGRFAKYREAVLWVMANRGPDRVCHLALDCFGGVRHLGRKSSFNTTHSPEDRAVAPPEA